MALHGNFLKEKVLGFLFISLLFCAFCFKKHRLGDIKYDLSKPCASYGLPDSLYEISGLTDIDEAHIGCVQDEKGIIFRYSLPEARIDSRSAFYVDGDYEGITLAGDDMYVLRSDGYLFRIKDYMNGKSVVSDSVDTEIPVHNNEGLCYDEKNNVLLIAAKGKIKKSEDMQDLRFVYGCKPGSLEMIDTAILIIDIDDIAYKMKESGISVPVSTKKNGETKYVSLKFMPSSIAVHPVTDRLYILSAVDNLLAVFNRNGAVEQIHVLPETLFPKPEGITFLPNGDMFISNEGKGGRANLMRFCFR